MIENKKYPNHKWAFYFSLVFIIFFALSMKLFFLEPSSSVYKFIKFFDRSIESLEYTTTEDGREIRRDGKIGVTRGLRSYTFVTFSLIISAIGLFGFCYSLSPSKTLAPFKKSFEKMISNNK